MGKKKKGKKKKGKKKKAGDEAESQELIPFPTDTRRYIHVSMHMQNWPHAERLWPKGGFWLETTTRLFYIHKLIKAKHGAVQNIRLWKESQQQENLLIGDMITLEQLGFEGEVKPEDRPKAAPSPLSADIDASGDLHVDDDGNTLPAEAVVFEEGMVVDDGEGKEVKSEPDAKEQATELEEDFTHYKFIYDFTPASLDDPLLLISPRWVNKDRYGIVPGKG